MKLCKLNFQAKAKKVKNKKTINNQVIKKLLVNKHNLRINKIKAEVMEIRLQPKKQRQLKNHKTNRPKKQQANLVKPLREEIKLQMIKSSLLQMKLKVLKIKPELI